MVEPELRVGVFRAGQKISELQMKTKLTSVSYYYYYYYFTTNRKTKSLDSMDIGRKWGLDPQTGDSMSLI